MSQEDADTHLSIATRKKKHNQALHTSSSPFFPPHVTLFTSPAVLELSGPEVSVVMSVMVVMEGTAKVPVGAQYLVMTGGDGSEEC